MTLNDVRYKIENEGFDYAFRHYSEFKEINDPEFHKLRLAYVEAANDLDDYIPSIEDIEGD